MAVEFFFSAAPTAQNIPELHFCNINSFIQLSLLRSLVSSQNTILRTFFDQKSFNTRNVYREDRDFQSSGTSGTSSPKYPVGPGVPEVSSVQSSVRSWSSGRS